MSAARTIHPFGRISVSQLPSQRRPLGSLREGAGSAARRRLREHAALPMRERSDGSHILAVGRPDLWPPLRTEGLRCSIKTCTGGQRSGRPTATASFYPNALFLRVRHSPSVSFADSSRFARPTGVPEGAKSAALFQGSANGCREVNSIASPVNGWSMRSLLAQSCWVISSGVPYCGSPRMGQPMWARWTRS